VIGLGLAGAVLTKELPRIAWRSSDLLGSYLLMGLLFAGELRRLRVVRRDGDTDRLTVSATFAVALVLSGPLSLAILAQGLATGLDDVRRRRPPLVLLFNQAQYAITLIAVRCAFALPQRQPLLALHPTVETSAILLAIMAAATYFAVNTALVDGVVALVSGQRLIDILREDLRVQGMSSAILLGLAPITAVVTRHSLLLVPLIVLPLLGVQRNAWIAAQRQYEALHDGLTGLPNRELFRLRAQQAVRSAGEDHTAVMLVDLDHFKEVNDTLGHQAGDNLLREVASRMTGVLTSPMTVARLGGDEFAVILPNAPSVAAVLEVAERMMGRLREPLYAEGVRIGVHASVGVAVHPDHADTVEGLLKRADIALYRAKVNRGEVQLYTPEMDEHTVERLSLLGDLQAASQNDEFTLAYQPQIDSLSATVVAVEALTRWTHPVHGCVPPDVFIPLAENSEMIATMTRRAVAAALAAVHTLDGDRKVSVSVNLSARLLSDLELPIWLNTCLRDADIPAERLTVEVTETSITADPIRAMKVLNDVRRLGVRIAIDDFGTGYSSLSYLRRLQPDEIKIDKSFVSQMLTDENSAVIVRSTIDLAHGLGLEVVAEGVEDQATYNALAALGCDRMQGFHIARPMSVTSLRSWVRRPGAGTRTASRVPSQGGYGQVVKLPTRSASA
jgi:diguanylate cyclase (GGDEF)-like protein